MIALKEPAGGLVALLAVCFMLDSRAAADMGTLRLAEPVGVYQVAVFTSPAPLRAGLVEVGVLVQRQDGGAPVRELPVFVTLRGEDSRIVRTASATAEGSSLLRAARFEIEESGWYQVDIRLDHDTIEPLTVALSVEVGPPRPRWWTFAPWIALPALAVCVFGLHQWLLHRMHRSNSTVTSGATSEGDGTRTRNHRIDRRPARPLDSPV